MLDQIKNTTEELLGKMGVSFDLVEVTQDDTVYRVSITSPEDGPLLIGWHGKNIGALQTIIRTLLNNKEDSNVSLTVDVENYRKKQEDNIIELANRKAEKVLETGESELMPPMQAFLRRLVHMHFAEKEAFKDLKTESIGEGYQRQIEIKLKK